MILSTGYLDWLSDKLDDHMTLPDCDARVPRVENILPPTRLAVAEIFCNR